MSGMYVLAEPGLNEQVTLVDGTVCQRFTTGWSVWSPDEHRWMQDLPGLDWPIVLRQSPRPSTNEDRTRVGLPRRDDAPPGAPITDEELAVIAFCAWDGQDPSKVTPADLAGALPQWVGVVRALRAATEH